jgi:hypothetical protein
MTVFLANTLIARTAGLGSVGDGSLLPKTRYCLIYIKNEKPSFEDLNQLGLEQISW